jgi:uncharacterized protein (DUF433 family)
MMTWMRTNKKLVTRSPDVMSGAAVFAGTRVPVKTLFDYLEAGDPLDEFLGDFPSVSRRQALSVLRDAEAAVEAVAGPA